MNLPLMPRASALWLIENTILTFDQIAAYVGLHRLEVQAIADGDVPVGTTTYDPITQGHLIWEEIRRCEQSPAAALKGQEPIILSQKIKKREGKYTPRTKRINRPHGIAWMLKHYPELPDRYICRLLGTTKQMICSLREKTHSNIQNITAQHPVKLELCSQSVFDECISNIKKTTTP